MNSENYTGVIGVSDYVVTWCWEINSKNQMQHYTRDTIQRLLNKKYGDIYNLTSSTVVIHILTHGINDDSIGFECNEGYGQKSEVQLENTGYTVNVIILRFTDHRVFSVCSKKKKSNTVLSNCIKLSVYLLWKLFKNSISVFLNILSLVLPLFKWNIFYWNVNLSVIC